MIDQCVLTTLDNPFDPFTKPKEWAQFDLEHGYASQQWLARFTYASRTMSEEDYRQEISDGIDRFLELNPLGIHYKLFKNQAKRLIPIANAVYEEVYGSKEQK